MSIVLPSNVRGPVLDLELPASADAIDLILRNKTTGRSLTLNLPEGWDGADLTLDFRLRTIRDASGADRSALLDPSDTGLWIPEPLVVEENDVEVEATGHLDTTFIDVLASELHDLTADGDYIYWSLPNLHAIGRAKIDGTEVDPEWMALSNSAGDLAINSTHIFWNRGGVAIGRAKIDGTEVDESWASGINAGGASEGFAIDSNYLYRFGLSAGRRIERINLSTAAVEKSFVGPFFAEFTGGGWGLAVSATHIFFGSGGRAIGRAKIDGTEVDPEWMPPLGEATLQNQRYVKGVHAGKLYWRRGRVTMARSNLDGSAVQEPLDPALFEEFVLASAVGEVGGKTALLYGRGPGGGGDKFIGRLLLDFSYSAQAAMRWERAYP